MSKTEEFRNQDDAIMYVPIELAKFSLGFAFDMGGSVTKLVYRSKEDYESGIPKDVNSPVGKLRLRYVNNDAAELVEFLQSNCDIISVSSAASSEPTVWYQTGMNYANKKAVLEEKLNVRLGVIFETTAMFLALRVFYADVTSSVYPRPLPMSERAVSKGRDACLQFVSALSNVRSAGEEVMGNYVNRPQIGFDLEEYRASLAGKDVSEVISEMTLINFREPFLLVLFGSVTQIFRVREGEKPVLINCMSSACRTLLHLSKVLTGAKSFNELADMIGRGKSRNVDEHASDIIENTGDQFYSEFINDMLCFSAGKLGQDKYKGTYSNDDIAASLALSFCSTTSKLVTLCAQQQNVKSVVFCGGFLCHPTTRECLEETFTAESLLLPFTGVDIIKMAILPNPGHLGALGVWQYNWELEQKEKQKIIN